MSKQQDFDAKTFECLSSVVHFFSLISFEIEMQLEEE